MMVALSRRNDEIGNDTRQLTLPGEKTLDMLNVDHLYSSLSSIGEKRTKEKKGVKRNKSADLELLKSPKTPGKKSPLRRTKSADGKSPFKNYKRLLKREQTLDVNVNHLHSSLSSIGEKRTKEKHNHLHSSLSSIDEKSTKEKKGVKRNKSADLEPLKSPKTPGKKSPLRRTKSADGSSIFKSYTPLLKKAARQPKTDRISSWSYTPRVAHPPTPQIKGMIKSIDREMAELEKQVVALFKELELADQKKAVEVKAAVQKKKKDQVQKLKGMELLQLDQLDRLGFDRNIVEAHLKKENKRLRVESKKSEQEKSNYAINNENLIKLNEESEKAVTAASQALHENLVLQQTLIYKLDMAEAERTSKETVVKHKKSMNATETEIKAGLKNALQEVVRTIERRCTDKLLVANAMEVASKVLSVDAGLTKKKKGLTKKKKAADKIVSNKKKVTDNRIANKKKALEALDAASSDEDFDSSDSEDDKSLSSVGSVSVSSCSDSDSD
jgi:hypothetical protein